LRDENVRKELDIVDAQDEKISKLGEKMREGMRELFNGYPREGSEEEKQKFRDEVQAKVKTRTDELRKELDSILLPQQRDRLKQLALQSRMRFQSTSQALASDDAAAALNLTEEQKEKLQTVQKEADEELRKEIEQLRKKIGDKILAVLTPEQQAKWKEMIGNPIEFAPPQFGRGGRGGPPGGAPNPGN
jgi:Spy/CpxP family protein refolding chaperone